jgi:plasmid stability protein
VSAGRRSTAQFARICLQVASILDMKTLYLRNVPDDVSDRLAVLAAREGLSVSAFAVRELTESARRADNAALLGELPDLGVSADEVVADLDTGRASR